MSHQNIIQILLLAPLSTWRTHCGQQFKHLNIPGYGSEFAAHFRECQSKKKISVEVLFLEFMSLFMFLLIYFDAANNTIRPRLFYIRPCALKKNLSTRHVSDSL